MAEKEGEEAIALQEEGEEKPTEVLWTNRYGFFDGRRFCLHNFPVWYRWRLPEQAPSPGALASLTKAEAPREPSVAERCVLEEESKVRSPAVQFRKATAAVHPRSYVESGVAYGVDWVQTLGRIELSCLLEGDEVGLSEEDFIVELSSWELRVTARYYVEGLQRLDHLCGDLYADVHKRLSWWSLVEDDGYGSGRRLHISLAKLSHKCWNGPWWLHPQNAHRRKAFPWSGSRWAGPVGNEDEMVTLPPGEPQDARNELLATLEPEGLCTGVDCDEEDDQHVYVVVHLDEENLDTATARLPIEELFAANVTDDSLEVFVSGVGYRLCSGKLTGLCQPEATTWEVQKALLRRVPRNSGIRAPSYYNPALRIKIVKADNAQGIWGGAYASMQGPEFRAPRERMSWTEKLQRALVLAPTAPLVASIKIAEAKKLCTSVECSQDADSALIIMHLHSRMEEYCWRYRFDLKTFFSMRVADRSLDMNVLADCEYTMCCGWLGGCCLPERTSWELVKCESREEQAATPKVVVASGGGQQLTVDEAITLTEELLGAFSRPNFRHRINALERQHGQGTAAFRQERQRLALAIQSRVLPRYGFEGSLSGVAEMARLIQLPAFVKNERLAPLVQQTNVLLGFEQGKPPPLADLREDPRFHMKREFNDGRVQGKFDMVRTERSKLVMNLSVVGLRLSGALKPMKTAEPAGVQAAPSKDLGPWLQAEVATSDGQKKGSVRLRLDEVTEAVMLDLRLPEHVSWLEDLQADLEAKVKEQSSRRQTQEAHFAVQVRVLKAPDSRRKWSKIFVRTEPGVPMPEEEEDGEKEEEATQNVEVKPAQAGVHDRPPSQGAPRANGAGDA